MTYSFTRTRTQIAQQVLGKLGVLAAGQSMASVDAETVYEALDIRLKELHRLGIHWRKVNEVGIEFNIPANTISASATADIIFPIQMVVVDGGRPVRIVDIREWNSIPDKTKTGNPDMALWKGGSEFLFSPIPTAQTAVNLVYESYAEDTSADAAIDIDVSMIRWFSDLIKYDLGDQYGKDQGTMQRWMAEASIAEKNLRKLSVQRVDYGPVQVESWSGVPVDYPTGP